MRFNKLDLNLLVALDAMLTLRSISGAADKLHMSQSAMSNALARLRDYFEDELLVQVGRRMELTPRADMLQEAVHDVLVRVDTTITAQPQFDPAQSDREFLIFVSDYTTAVLMPHVMALAAEQSKTIRFSLLSQSHQTLRSLERGEADLLVVPQGYCSPDHPTEVLFEEDFCCAVWSGSPLARREMTLETYTNAGHVVMRLPGANQLSFEAWIIERIGVARRVDITTFSFLGSAGLLVGSDRITTMHCRLARQVQRMLPITLLPLPTKIEPMKQSMQWHKYRTQDPGLIWLRQLMLAAAKRMDATDTTLR